MLVLFLLSTVKDAVRTFADAEWGLTNTKLSEKGLLVQLPRGAGVQKE